MPLVVVNHELAAALDVARRLLEQPELVLSGQNARDHIIALAKVIEENKCFKNAMLKGREVFTLSSEDALAPSTIIHWSELAHRHSVNPIKVADAIAIADRWVKGCEQRMPD